MVLVDRWSSCSTLKAWDFLREVAVACSESDGMYTVLEILIVWHFTPFPQSSIRLLVSPILTPSQQKQAGTPRSCKYTSPPTPAHRAGCGRNRSPDSSDCQPPTHPPRHRTVSPRSPRMNANSPSTPRHTPRTCKNSSLVRRRCEFALGGSRPMCCCTTGWDS